MREDGVKVLKLIADVATHWNSLVISGKRFLEILPSIVKALNHRKIKSAEMWNDHDTEVLKVIMQIFLGNLFLIKTSQFQL